MQKKIIKILLILTLLVNNKVVAKVVNDKVVNNNKVVKDFYEIDSLIAKIGNEIILKSELDQILKNKYGDKNISFIQECNELENLFKLKFLLFYAKKNNMINHNYVNEQAKLKIQYLVKNNNLSPTIKLMIYNQIKNTIYYNSIYQIINNNIYVSPKEIDDYIINNKKIIVPLTFELSSIIFYPKITNDHKKEIINKLLKIKNEIENGSDFKTKAISYSDDIKSAINGGLITLNYETINNEYKNIIFYLKEGEISKPFQTEEGFQILKLEKIIGNKIYIRLILIKPKYTKEELLETKKIVNSVMNDIINNNISFEKAKNKYHFFNKKIDNINKNIDNHIDMDHIRLNQYEIKNKIPIIKNINKIPINNHIMRYEYEINGEPVFILIKIKKIPQHKLSFNKDYELIKNLIIKIKYNENIDNFIKKNIKYTLIQINKKYKNSKFYQNWIKYINF
ncbi:MAG: peptidylprolyl isomerase [Candidatus Bostrichicola ureolyticus]|nr:MAG: peptidylprolyl isomerase [Candidatus Bostrichicola ureolyticus]